MLTLKVVACKTSWSVLVLFPLALAIALEPGLIIVTYSFAGSRRYIT